MCFTACISKFGRIFAAVKERIKFLRINKSPIPIGNTKIKIMMIMSRTNETIEMLQYQLKRYKAMKKGAACQSLQFKLQKLMTQANA